MTETTPPAPVPTLLRRHAAGAESARSVLFTVLGELVLPTGGEAWTSAFIDVFGRLGVEEKAARQALMRTATDNWLSSERVGRRTVWRLTPAAERLLRDGTERIFGFTAVAADWDGQWTIVIARTPESERAARHMLRTRLRWAGFGSVMPGVWLSPRSDRGGEVRRILDEAQLPDGYLFTAEYQGGTSVAAMVGHAWDLAELAREYDEFTAAFSGDVSPDPLVRVIDLVHAWRRFPWIDPGLPGPVPARALERHRSRRVVRPAARAVGRRRDRRVEAASGQDVTRAAGPAGTVAESRERDGKLGSRSRSPCRAPEARDQRRPLRRAVTRWAAASKAAASSCALSRAPASAATTACPCAGSCAEHSRRSIPAWAASTARCP